MVTVFISYSHDSEQHKLSVHALADQLRAQHIHVILDRDMLPGGPNEGWDHWSEAQLRNESVKVLMVCTERYRARYEGREIPGVGLGATAEARHIHRLLYNAAWVNPRFRVVLLQPADQAHVPDTLQSYHSFALFQPQGMAELLSWLTESPIALSAPTENRRIAWPTPATPFQWDMANRTLITAKLEQMLTGRSQKRVLLLKAASNSGKTHLMTQLKRYAKHLKLARAMVDCKGEVTLSNLLELLLLDLNLVRASDEATQRMNLLEELLRRDRPVLLTFDTYEQASLPAKYWLETQLLPRLDDCPGVVAVIAGQEIPERASQELGDLAEEEKLEPITKVSDWFDYCRRKGHEQATLAHVEALTHATGGNPGQLSALLETMMTSLKSGAGA